MVKTNIQTFSGEVEILSNLHVGSYLTANGAASNVLDITGNVGATFFVGDGGFLSNIATTLSDIVNQGNVVSNVVTFEGNTNYAGVGLVTSSNVGIQNTNPLHTLSIGDKIRVNNNTDESLGESVIEVDGRILATRFEGDGGLLSNIATTLESIVNQGNVSANVVKFSSNALVSEFAGAGLVTDSNVGIQNTAPTYNLSVGSNLHVNDTGSNVLTVHGNVVASNLNLGVFSVTPAYGLNDVCNTSNGTSNVVQFQNATTSLVATSNITVGGNVTAQQLISTSNTEVGDRLKFSGSNVFVDTLRVADVAANIVTYDRTTGELLDSSGTFMNKFAVVSEQPPSDLFANATTVTNHGGYTLTTSNLATNSNTFNAFDGTANAWVSGDLAGGYIGGANVFHENNLTQLSNLHPTQFGDWLAIEFPYKTTLRHMKLTPLTAAQFPASANIYATNNDLTWTEINYWKDVNPVTASNVQTITVNATEQFKKYALVATKAAGNSSNVAIQDWQLFTESFSIDGGKVAMAQQAATGGETVMDQHGPHGRGAAVLKKYPEIAFAEGKFDSNETTNTYVQAGYTVTGSGFVNSSNHPWKAFNGIDFEVGMLLSGLNYDTSGNANTSGTTASRLSASDSTPYGEWLKLELPNKIKLDKYVFTSRNHATHWAQGPEAGQVWGSNDDSNWVHLHTFTNSGFTGESQSASFDVQTDNYYKYYAFIVTKTFAAGTDYYLCVPELEFYGYEEDPPLGDTSVDTTFTSIMNTPQTTGAQVYVDAKLSSDFTNRVVGPTVSNTHTTYVSAEKYWELSGNVESNVTLEANTFLSGDAPHSLSVWFNSSNLVSNASNSCIFSLNSGEEKFYYDSLDEYKLLRNTSYRGRMREQIIKVNNEDFGWSVATNSDGSIMIVGCPGEDAGQTNWGAVYIYTYSNGSWDDGVRIGAPTQSGTSDQAFGYSVDMNSNGTKVVVGSRYGDEGANDAGAAYVYSYINGTWTLDTVTGVATGRIQASDRAANDEFGTSVSMNGDGTRIIVGAKLEDTPVTGAGKAYIYTYSSGSWGSEKIIQALDASSGGDANFGTSVGMNSDGTKVVVGAPTHDTGGSDIGAAYVFIYNSSSDSWSQQEKIQASDKITVDHFGYCVSMSGDGTKIIVTSPYDDFGSLTSAGAAYIYTYNNGSWYDSGNNEQKITASDRAVSTNYGWSAAINYDGTKVIVGAKYEDTGGTNHGAAYIHDYNGSSWSQRKKLSALSSANYDHYGQSVAITSGDVEKFMVGARGDAKRSVYIYTPDIFEQPGSPPELKLQSNTWHNLTYAYQGEGGSRVTYLDGRKVAEDQAEDTFGEYPHIKLDDYSKGGYNVTASYYQNNLTRAPYNLFTGDTQGARMTGWTGANIPPDPTDANYDAVVMTLTDTTGTAHLGHWVSLELPYKLSPTYCEFEHYSSSYRLKDFVILGSNHDPTLIKTGFTLLFSGQAHVDNNGTDKTIHTFTGSGKFKYLIFLSKTLNTGNSTWIMERLKYYGHRENDLVRLPDPTNVLKYPHIAMTGPAQRGYVASASTQDSTGSAYIAFDGIADGSRGYHGTGVYSSGVYQGNDKLTGPGPTDYDGEWIKLELPHKIKVTGVSFAPRTLYPDRIPYKGYILGSNTGSDGSWELVHSFDNVTTTEGVTKRIDFTGTNVYYKHIAMVAEETNPTPGTRLNFSEMEYYGTEEATSVPIQIGGGNIDKVANFRVYDKFIGEDQALEIWDAQKDEFGRAKSSMTLHKGRIGIGTTEPQGRLAVADEPDPTTYGLQRFPPKPLCSYKNHFEGHGEFCVSASSELSDTYPAWEVFNQRGTFDDVDAWISAMNRYTLNSYIDVNPAVAANINGIYGEWLELKLPYKINLSYIVIRSRDGDGNIYGRSGGPAAGNVWGSNDGVNWTLLTSFSNLTYGFITVHGFSEIVDVNSIIPYSYIRLQPTKRVATNGADGWIGFGELKLFGTREQVTKQSVLHDGQLTLTKSLTVPRIGPALDADDTPRRDRLVVEYNTSTNPTFEGAVRDTSGRGNDGIMRFGATYDAAAKSLEFPLNPSTPSNSGNRDSIETGPILDGTTLVKGYSVSTWFRADSQGAWEQVWVLGKTGLGKHEGLWLSGSSTVSIHNDAGGGLNYYYPCSSGGNWKHVTFVRKGTTASDHDVYVDGVKVSASSTAGGTNVHAFEKDSKLILGENIDRNDYGFDGAISNFKLYDTALTASEAKTLYDMGRCDEGHHTVNFSKTRVGIGLGDGEAPTYTLDVRGQIRSQGSLVTSFTGQHKCIPDEPMEKGLIVSAKKNQFVKLNGLAIGKSAITIDESLPIVSLSNVAQDKACFGVVSSIEEANTTFRVETTNGGVISTIPKTLGDNRAIVNSVGEGAIWVVDTNGSLESGDYITTSNVVGYGQKQDDDILHNYTVAKITMDCDFTGSNVAVQTIKREETGLRTIMEDTWNQLVDYDRSSNTETQYSNTLAPSAYTDQPGYTPREVTTIVDYTDGSNIVSIAEWSNLESNIQNTYQSNTFTEIVDYTKFVNLSEWSNLTTDVQNTYSEAEITTYYQIQRGENVLDENGQLQFEDKTGATEAPYERRFLDASGAQTDEANAVHIAAFVGCTYHCG
jgi:hypothetical protein